ncbi:outer membrane protein assembly factor BamC [Hahella ganghwensis]|uniref:outer membrane protein assembly factor BamC n=1 Tax=Hahella ganghwensis TaxID=286420 RepID=UPI00037BB910|nr:outer membrane protein assembly factor BamC [Hahella ganghwensis]
MVEVKSMRIIYVLCGVALVVTSGCSLIKDRTDQYMAASKGEPMVVPEWYSDRRLRDRYPVPEADQGFVATKEFQVPPPPEPGLEILLEQFVVKSTESDTWLLASEAPGKIWPALKTYWESQGAEVREVNTSAGNMQVRLSATSLKVANFLENNGLKPFVRNDEVLLHIYVQQGLKRRSSEVRVAPVMFSEFGADTQQALLSGVKGYLDENAESLESYSLVAQNIGGEEKLALVNEAGTTPYIRVKLDFERAWFAVGEALTKSEASVVDLNRSEGIYFVRYSKEEKKKSGGFFGWLKGEDQDLLSDRFNFRVELTREADGIHITSLPTKSDVDPQDQVRLLNQLLDHLS